MLDIKYNYLTGSSEPFPDNYDIDKRIDPDYIGPSVYWARESGINDAQIKSFLELSRTIGGHM